MRGQHFFPLWLYSIPPLPALVAVYPSLGYPAPAGSCQQALIPHFPPSVIPRKLLPLFRDRFLCSRFFSPASACVRSRPKLSSLKGTSRESRWEELPTPVTPLCLLCGHTSISLLAPLGRSRVFHPSLFTFEGRGPRKLDFFPPSPSSPCGSFPFPLDYPVAGKLRV